MTLITKNLPAIVLSCFFACGNIGHVKGGTMEDALTGHIWSYKHGSIDTALVFNRDGTVRMKNQKADYRWKTTGERMIGLEMEKGRRMSLEFDEGITGYKETAAAGGGASGKRLGARKDVPAVNTVAELSGMAFHPRWMPTKLDTKKLYALNLEYFCLKVVDGNRAAPDVIPDNIWNGITWLMPLQQAIAMLPKGARKHFERPMQNLVFPQESLFLHTYAMDGQMQFNDRGSPFKYLTFITDLNKRVISIQLVNEKPPNVIWENGVPDGVKNPYFNFLQDRFKGSGSYSVPYQVCNSGKGVKLVKTAFCKGIFQIQPLVPGAIAGNGQPLWEFSEDVHWYLTDPLAKKILFIVETHREAGRLK